MSKNNNISLGHIPEEIRPPSRIPPYLAAILSAIIPGVGQILGHAVRRGIILLGSFLSIMGLVIWRFRLAAPRDVGVFNIIKKGLHLEPILILVTILIIVLYVLIIIDAYNIVKVRDRTPIGAFFMVIIVFFALGWQIGDINLYTFFSQADEAIPALSKIVWPWEKAITQDVDYVRGYALIEIPCSDNPPPPSSATEGEPLLIANPTCGNLTVDEDHPGTLLHLVGKDFIPGIEADIMWKDPIRNEFRQRSEGHYVKVIPDENGDFELDIHIPYRLLPPSADQPTYIWKVFAQQVATVGSKHLSSDFKNIVERMIETIFIGMMATFFGVIFALPVSFFAARNLMSASPITLVLYYLVRAVLNIIRSIEPLIWAIIAVIVVGLGPFAGILALTLHSIAALGKLYSESIESISTGPIEAIQATGATWVQTVMFAVIPQIVPPFVSFTIYRWDVNIRMSTIIGFVGGGGIGFLLAQYIRLLDYKSAGMAVWFIAITVAILDYVSAEIRAKFV
ncbi:MAG TPA: phosphonate ABC transporter, permease protein PhnE [Anaerolineae bacterium]|nr:phosphonate ABC transporter, permease protein PhnE [Anaerolineae bacterium]